MILPLPTSRKLRETYGFVEFLFPSHQEYLSNCFYHLFLGLFFFLLVRLMVSPQVRLSTLKNIVCLFKVMETLPGNGSNIDQILES